MAAILGAGTAAAWSAERTAASRRIGLALMVAGTAAYGAWLVPGTASRPGWARATPWPRSTWPARPRRSWRRGRTVTVEPQRTAENVSYAVTQESQ